MTNNNNNNNRRLITLAEHTSDHGKQTNSSTKERGSTARKLLGAKAKNYRLELKLKLRRLVSISTDKASTGWQPPSTAPGPAPALASLGGGPAVAGALGR